MATMLMGRAGALPRVDKETIQRAGALATGLVMTLFAAGLYRQASWATWLWPWDDVKMSYVFLASILAAAIAPTIWIGLTGELAVVAPGALNTLLLNLMFAAYLALRAVRHDQPTLLIGVAINLALVPPFVVALRRSRRLAVRDTRPMPWLIGRLLWAICALLVVVGLPLLLQIDHIFPWELTPETSTMFGCFFLGAAGYFAYVARTRYWVFAAAPLLGFLAYDAVLLSSYVDFFRDGFAGLSASGGGAYGAYYGYGTTAAGGDGVNERSLVVYLGVLGVSAALAVFTLFVHAGTRFRFVDRLLDRRNARLEVATAG